jgi:DNA-directed RNA polymerase sigma subunit (sigma70/sigma32)
MMDCLAVGKSGALKTYLRVVASLPRLDEADQAALEPRARAGDEDAVQSLTESFLGLVVSEANAFRGRGRRFEALIAAGNRGLSEALRRGEGPLGARVRSGVRRHLRAALEQKASGSGR